MCPRPNVSRPNVSLNVSSDAGQAGCRKSTSLQKSPPLRLVMATQRKNVIALARMLGYRMHGAGAATATAELVLTLARACSNPPETRGR
jgi:hypothetical protein